MLFVYKMCMLSVLYVIASLGYFRCAQAETKIDFSSPNHTQAELDRHAEERFKMTGVTYDHYIHGRIFGAISKCRDAISREKIPGFGSMYEYDYIIGKNDGTLSIRTSPRFIRLPDVDVNNQNIPLYGYAPVSAFRCEYHIKSRKIISVEELVL